MKSQSFPTIAILVSVFFLVFISSCDTPEKVLKSTDIEYKKMKAIQWYNKGEYVKCIPVFEELIGLMKGRQSTEDLYYMYADANYHQGDYLISAYHFKNFYELYPNSPRAEECLFRQAESYQMLSPKPSLDQTYTNKAIDAYQLFLNTYPSESHFTVEANDAIEVLRRKLQRKELDAADLYYRTSNFKAAAVTYINVLKDFPDIVESEKITFLIIKSGFQYAANSIPIRKMERYEDVIKKYADFKYKFSKSIYLAEASQLEAQSHYLAAKSAYEAAESVGIAYREPYYNTFFGEAATQRPYITDTKQLREIDALVEKAYFLTVKDNYQVSEERRIAQKKQLLELAIKNYYTFVDKYPKSRYSKQVERIFNDATKQLEKIKTDG